jgi:hypothetical protein
MAEISSSGEVDDVLEICSFSIPKRKKSLGDKSGL